MSNRGAILLSIGTLILGLVLGFAAGGFTGFFMGQSMQVNALSRIFGGTNPQSPNFQPGQGRRGFQQATPAPQNPQQSQQPTPVPRGGLVPPAQAIQNGAVVTDVDQSGPASKAGLQAGDVITAVDNTKLDDNHQLADLIQAHKPGDKVSLSVTRGSQNLTLTVTLGQSPQDNSLAYLGIRYGVAPSTAPSNGPSNPPQRRFQQPGGNNNFPNG